MASAKAMQHGSHRRSSRGGITGCSRVAPPDGEKPKSTLNRTTFETNRSLEYFSERELIAQTGHEPQDWPPMLVKELVDNAVDECESAGVAPEVAISVDEQSITVGDKGRGIPVETVRAALDYRVRVSDKARYVSPTRGSQGNALKALFAIPYVLDGKQGRVEVSTGGKGYEILVRADEIQQQPIVELRNSRPALVKTGSAFRVHWPQAAISQLGAVDDEFLQMARAYAWLNPHLVLTVETPRSAKTRFTPTDPAWRKWLPTDPTSPAWYTVEDFARLIASYIHKGRQIGRVSTAREFVAEFAGLSGSAKQKSVLDSVGLNRADLEALAPGGELDLQPSPCPTLFETTRARDIFASHCGNGL
jgi:Histidine kinase-, DNA gyrase B-, and HSP90-like ATPase